MLRGVMNPLPLLLRQVQRDEETHRLNRKATLWVQGVAAGAARFYAIGPRATTGPRHGRPHMRLTPRNRAPYVRQAEKNANGARHQATRSWLCHQEAGESPERPRHCKRPDPFFSGIGASPLVRPLGAIPGR
jgi:hypothetical protein